MSVYRTRRRRLVIATLGASVLPKIGAAQPKKLPRVGLLSLAVGPSPYWRIFEDELHTRGWKSGESIKFDLRFAGGRPERLAALAAELVGLPVDVLVADLGTALAAAEATTRIPIVMRFGLDAVEAGVVGKLGRPARNITGLTGDVTGEVMSKRLELLRELAPSVRRVAVLTNVFPGLEAWERDLEHGARALGFTIHLVPVQGKEALPAALQAIRAAGHEALFCGGDAVTFSLRPQITGFALRERLPAVYGPAEWAEDGGLISYGVNLAALYRQTADYVDRILRGALPSDLPVSRPLKYELAVNLKTAKALGISVPASLLVRADRVIQ